MTPGEKALGVALRRGMDRGQALALIRAVNGCHRELADEDGGET